MTITDCMFQFSASVAIFVLEGAVFVDVIYSYIAYVSLAISFYFEATLNFEENKVGHHQQQQDQW